MRRQIRAGKLLRATLCGLVFGVMFAAGARAQTSVLYDGSLKTTPSAQGWFFIGTGGTQTAPGESGYATLDTTASNSIQAGYSILTPFALKRTTGFTVRFDVRLVTENHDAGDKNGDGLSDRAGFCVLALGDDRKGVELDFWAGEVWPQSDSPLFLHLPGPERAFLNTTASGRGAARRD